ncbi:MAG TPA: hypothetical protein DEF34_04965 [Desulfotomaculum sp.]|nr:MAG: hypothetical protein JL56_13740 [Desulfotomaculum sp. BICA1-6]HBX22968.1 hypothetical protein [Desulfotomaculum sp.]
MSGAAMTSVADVLPAAMQGRKLTCRRCGSEVGFGARQWRRRCGRCGLVITLPVVLWDEQQEQEPACFICTDRGLVFYQEQRGRLLYEFAALCTCRVGQQRSEIGLPRVDQVDNIGSLAYLAKQNRAAWEKRTGRRAGGDLPGGAHTKT